MRAVPRLAAALLLVGFAAAEGATEEGGQRSPRILAYHFDMKRPMWRREYMEQMVDHLKGWGFTHIVYEIEDKFQYANHPDLRHPEAPSHAEHASFVSFCRKKGMEYDIDRRYGRYERLLKQLTDTQTPGGGTRNAVMAESAPRAGRSGVGAAPKQQASSAAGKVDLAEGLVAH